MVEGGNGIMSNKRDCWKCHWSWLGRCMHSNHYGADISIISKQSEDCKNFITNADWNKQYRPMTIARAKLLLNSMIINLSVDKNISTVLNILFNIGFTKEELINEFNFSYDDVNEAVKNFHN